MAGSQRTGGSRRIRVAFWISAAAWLLALVAFVGLVSLEWAFTADAARRCPLGDPGSPSWNGESRWSWAELGEVCRFELPTVSAFEEGPGLTRWGFLAALLGWGSALALSARLLWPRRSGPADDEPRRAETASPS